MKRIMARLPLAILALAAAGCSTVGNGGLVQLDAPQAQALLVPGRSTRDEVRQALGEGAIIHFESGMETWRYQYREGVAKGWDQVPYIGLITARLDRPTKELVILFDASGVLRRWSLQEYRARPPTPAG
jgi:hypothetical protein